jgi:hypothetical protein
MALLHLALATAVLWASAFSLPAQEPAARSVELRFVPAVGEGTVSLGIYDASGRLVRVLADEWTFNRFRVGLDGLSTTWDGLDQAGQPVPAGTYAARGFIVGDVDIRGEAFYFNDWIEAADSPRIEAVAARQLLPGGDVLLAARLAGAQGALVRYSPESDVRWHTLVQRPRPQPAQSARLAVSDTLAFILLDGEMQAARLEDGGEVSLPMPVSGVKAIAARGQQLAVLDGEGLRFYALPDFSPRGSAGQLPPGLGSVALLDDGAVAAAEDGSVWLWQKGWRRLDIPAEVKVRAVSGGAGRTFWALQEMAGGLLSVAQYSPEEGRLAEWSPGPQDGKLTAVAGAVERDYFVASLELPGVQRTVAIRRKEGGGGWEFVFDKKITASARFGWANYGLVPASEELPEELKVPLAENPLDPAAPASLVLRAVAGQTGTGLSTTDGLPLLRVSDEGRFGRVMLMPGTTPDTARFFQGDGACVEEYTLSRLGEIMSFDAGRIEMTPTGEATPPPIEEPESE